MLRSLETSLVVQWLGLYTFNAGNWGSIRDQGTKTPHASVKILHATTKTQYRQIQTYLLKEKEVWRLAVWVKYEISLLLVSQLLKDPRLSLWNAIIIKEDNTPSYSFLGGETPKLQLAPSSTSQILPPVTKVEAIEQLHSRNMTITGYER